MLPTVLTHLWRRNVWSDADAGAYSAALGRSTYVRSIANALAPYVRPSRAMLDIGAGDGRFAMALTRRRAEVAAVEPCAAMRRRLVARVSGARRLRVYDTTWEWLPDGRFDLGFAANIAAFKIDPAGLHAAMRARCRRMVWVVPAQQGPSSFCLSGLASALLPERTAAPVYLDVLRRLGPRRKPARVLLRTWTFVRHFASARSAEVAMAEWIAAAGGAAAPGEVTKLVAEHARPAVGGGVTLACPKSSAILVWDR